MNEEFKQQTFLKTLASHAIKTVVATILISVLGGIGTSFVFYHQANNAIDNLMINDKKQDTAIKEVNQTLEQINNKLGGTSIDNAIYDTKIKGIEQQLTQMQEQQKTIQHAQMEMLKILAEMNRK